MGDTQEDWERWTTYLLERGEGVEGEPNHTMARVPRPLEIIQYYLSSVHILNILYCSTAENPQLEPGIRLRDISDLLASYAVNRDGIFKRLRSPGIYSNESIP